MPSRNTSTSKLTGTSGSTGPTKVIASERTGRRGNVEIKNLTLWFEGDALAKWDGEYFPEQDEALAKKMARFGNLAKDKKKKGR